MPKEYIEYQNEITSADDLNKQGRKSNVLIKALEKCEKLEKQLKIAVECLEEYANKANWENGTTADKYNTLYFNALYCVSDGYQEAETALKQIKEIK